MSHASTDLSAAVVLGADDTLILTEPTPQDVRRPCEWCATPILEKLSFTTGYVYKSDGRDVKVFGSNGTPLLRMEHADLEDILHVLLHALGRG